METNPQAETKAPADAKPKEEITWTEFDPYKGKVPTSGRGYLVCGYERESGGFVPCMDIAFYNRERHRWEDTTMVVRKFMVLPKNPITEKDIVN